MRGRQGTHAGSNPQIVVDEKHGLIASADVTNHANNLDQFSNQITQAIVMLGKKPDTAVADAGYAKGDDLKNITDQGIDVIVPSQ